MTKQMSLRQESVDEEAQIEPQYQNPVTIDKLPAIKRHKHTSGMENNCGASCVRIGEISYFFLFGCLLNLMDSCYSYLTKQNRVIGEGRHPQQGIDHLDSLFLISAFEQSDHKNFLITYYHDVNPFDAPDNAFEELAAEMQRRLYIDIILRNYRKELGANIIAWTSTIVSLSLPIAEFVRTIITIGTFQQYIGYSQAGFGLLGLMITQITNRQIQTHSKAAANLEDTATFLREYIRDRLARIEKEKSRERLDSLSIPPPAPSASVSTVSLFKKPPSSRIRKLNAFKDQPVLDQLLTMKYTLCDISDNLDLYKPITNLNSLADIKNWAHAYDCPVIVVSESPLDDCCQIINEEANLEEESKEMENIQQYLSDRLDRYMIIYCNSENHYQPVIAPTNASDFATVKQQLSRLNRCPLYDARTARDYFQEGKEGSRAPTEAIFRLV